MEGDRKDYYKRTVYGAPDNRRYVKKEGRNTEGKRIHILTYRGIA